MALNLRGLRLASGLVLTLFVTGSMANLMLGMHSLARPALSALLRPALVLEANTPW